MNKFIRNNFLAICITLAVIFAFAKKATIFQQDKPQLPQHITAFVNQENNKTFTDYWKAQGKETSKFTLKQDSSQIGEAILFYTLKEFGKDQPNGAISSLSSNLSQKIVQDSYDYTANSTAVVALNTPLYPHALTVVSSFQSANGTDFISLQQEPKNYLFVGRNHTELEKEIRQITEKGNLEDEIWAKIRMQPDALPQGEMEMIPSLNYWNKIHKAPSIQEAKAELKSTGNNPKLKTYTLDYPVLNRKLEIIFEANFPFQIREFTETIEGKTIRGLR